MAKMIRVMTKAHKRRGVVYPAQPTDYEVCIDKGKITIFKNGVEGTSFMVGEKAEYDSWNLRYIGDIAKITPNTVTIIAYKGHSGMEQTHRLDMNSFCYRNWDFNYGEAVSYNQNESMYL